MVWADPAQPGRRQLRKFARRYGVRGAGRARALPADHPAGVVPRSRGPAAHARCARPAISVRRPWSCTRRSAGSAATPTVSPTWSPNWRTRAASRSPWRTCSRCVRSAQGQSRVGVRAVRRPDRRRVTAHYTLDLSHTAAAHVDALDLAARMGAGLRTPAPRRRLRRHPATNTSSPAGAASRAHGCASGCGTPTSTARWCWRSTPGAPRSPAGQVRDLAEALLFARRT